MLSHMYVEFIDKRGRHETRKIEVNCKQASPPQKKQIFAKLNHTSIALSENQIHNKVN